MALEIRVPTLGESVTEATVAKWLRNVGDAIAADEPLVELETDKVTVEVNAPASGTLSEIKVDAGATVEVGALLGSLAEGAAPAKKPRGCRRSRRKPPHRRRPPHPPGPRPRPPRRRRRRTRARPRAS